MYSLSSAGGGVGWAVSCCTGAGVGMGAGAGTGLGLWVRLRAMRIGWDCRSPTLNQNAEAKESPRTKYSSCIIFSVVVNVNWLQNVTV